MVMRMADDKVMENQFQQLMFSIINTIKESQEETKKEIINDQKEFFWIKNGMEEKENEEKVADAGTPAADDDCVVVAKDALCPSQDFAFPGNEGATPSNGIDVTLREIAIPVEFAVPVTEVATTDVDGHLKGNDDKVEEGASLGANIESPDVFNNELSMKASCEDTADWSGNDDPPYERANSDLPRTVCVWVRHVTAASKSPFPSTAVESCLSGQKSEMAPSVQDCYYGSYARLLERRELCPVGLKKHLQCVIGTVT